MDVPLAHGNWPLIGAVGGAVVAAATSPARDDRAPTWTRCAPVRRRDAMRGIEAGFDMLELHCAHGYLLSAFISPLTNRRDRRVWRQRSRTACASRSRCSRRCARSGRPTSRCRCASRPTTGSATGHHAGRRGRDRAAPSRRPAPTSSTSRPARPRPRRRPVYGRMFQTPFADRIRNEAGIADHGGRQHLRDRPRQLDHRRRPRRPRARSPGRIWPTRPGRCTPRPRSATARRPGRRRICAGATSSCATAPAERLRRR